MSIVLIMEKASLQLIVGLGNPTSVYKETRHNIGFMTLDRLASTKGLYFKRNVCDGAAIAQGTSGQIFMKPLTYMNYSGYPVVAFLHSHKISPEHTLIILDDCTIPLGKLRIRKNGSSGGHNGLASVLCCLSTEEIPRLRIGIGSVRLGARLTEYVLSVFLKEEIPIVHQSITRACKAIDMLALSKIDTVMNQFN